MKVALGKCNIPCKGIYTDWIRRGIEDLEVNEDFQHVLEEYNNYKSGGGQLFICMEKLFRIVTKLNLSPSVARLS